MVVLYCLLASSLIVTVVTWWKLDRVTRLFRVTSTVDEHATSSLPSVSLCIPARNEVHAMSDCLESALRSAYPKLEIIVLDDDSRDTTGQLIRAFAHAGVRFVEGAALPDGWLGKNYALSILAREASADIILFADVDTRFSPHSIERLVAYMQAQDADMVSVLPTRADARRASAILATMRSFWNMVRHTRAYPASSSSVWMIRRDALESAGGFAARPLDVSPDRFFAHATASARRYRFALSSPDFGVTYEKKLSSQYETAIRLYYPLFGLGGVVLRVLGLMAILTPWFIACYGLVTADGWLAAAAVSAMVLTLVVHMWYLGIVRSRLYVLSVIVFPFVVCREIGLLLRSVYDYKRGTVLWKGRPVRRHASLGEAPRLPDEA